MANQKLNIDIVAKDRTRQALSGVRGALGKLRSSIGIGIDWFSVIGPVNFSLSEAISKADTDITESFRFNIGTTF